MFIDCIRWFVCVAKLKCNCAIGYILRCHRAQSSSDRSINLFKWKPISVNSIALAIHTYFTRNLFEIRFECNDLFASQSIYLFWWKKRKIARTNLSEAGCVCVLAVCLKKSIKFRAFEKRVCRASSGCALLSSLWSFHSFDRSVCIEMVCHVH